MSSGNIKRLLVAEKLETAETESTDQKRVLLTGAQVTGELHLGNYLGAIRHWVKLQEERECFFILADLHAITCPQDPTHLRQNTLKTLAQFLACGLDPTKSCLFLQSSVHGHTDLAWILSCLTPLGQLFRMTQFKSKSQEKEGVGSGLLYYPILMAADILLYNAHQVTIGEDQKQHLELARDLAVRFNQTYSDTFNVPEPHVGKTGGRIYSLQSPMQKMSKSDPNPKGILFLADPPETIRKKFQSAVTDSGQGIYRSKTKPGVTNLIHIFGALTDQSLESIEKDYGSRSYAEFKDIVAEATIRILAPFREAYRRHLEDKEGLLKILREGGEKASHKAQKTLSKVCRKVGFVDLRSF